MRPYAERSRWWWAAAMLLCLLPGVVRAADPATAATVLNAAGNVSVVRDDVVWALFPGNAVNVGETIITGADGYATLQVSDGSSFFVYPNSRVVFRKNPGSLFDLLDIFLGRVRVHIQRLTGGAPNPHRVFTPTAVISVRGTSFDVDVGPDETTFVIVDEGVVNVNHRLLPSNEDLTVSAGEHIVIYRNVPLAEARVDKVRAAQIAEDIARTAAYIWNRIGRRAPGGAGGGASPPLPGDVPAPSPPLPGDTPPPDPPPPPE